MIRSIRKDEIGECVEVIKQSFATVAAEFGITKDNAPSYILYSINEEKLNDQFNSGRLMIVYYEADRIVGYYSLNIYGDECELNNLCVLPSYRNRNIGKALLRNAIENAKKAGVSTIHIGIVEENTKLKNWYESFGFVSICTKKYNFFPFTTGIMKLKI